jgi:hypothetical protein
VIIRTDRNETLEAELLTSKNAPSPRHPITWGDWYNGAGEGFALAPDGRVFEYAPVPRPVGPWMQVTVG